MDRLLALVVFAFVGSVSPGPNNAVLWASGMRFGFRRTLPHVAGTALGIGALVVGVAVGIGVVLRAVPSFELVLKVAGSAYLLFVAVLVLGSHSFGRASVSHPLSFRQAVTFQWLNPKGWIFAIAAVGAFVPPGMHRSAGVGVITGIVMVVVVGSSSIWAAAGAALGGIIEDERTGRIVSIVLATLLVGSVALLWI
jgi:threonine/homoserine/homoserine lactone efflux protein